MLTKFVLPGEKVELQTFEKTVLGGASDKKTYSSRIFDILDEEQFEILMPMDKTKLILLPVDGVYDMCFYTKNGLYQANVRIVDRYKSGNIYILLCELTTELRKHQRREFYRYATVLPMKARPLDKEELEIAERNQIYFKDGQQLFGATVVDISGGGIRFISKDIEYEPDAVIYIAFSLPTAAGMQDFEISGKILSKKEIPEKAGEFEYRVQYVNIDPTEREKIIRYIFEEERKNRQRKNGR